MSSTTNEKIIAAKAALKLVEHGMVVGLGSGSTSAIMIELLGKACREGLNIKGVASSGISEKLAIKEGIPVISLDVAPKIDINIDGADEFDTKLQLIKGGGGALLREKIIAHFASKNVIIVDSSKKVEQLGSFPLPIEVIPFAQRKIMDELGQMGLSPQVRLHNGKEYRTDQHNSILDLDIQGQTDLETLQSSLINIPGIVETGLFLNTTNLIIMGSGNETKTFQ
ncbi:MULTISPECIES: ribose-5-phosphate isomerase RpiA [Flagellimonas]|uniref:Ribose-5-phosphate isomerase A n=1 Tax=Flagellimonas hadalis TaxID=2597517 RepID=A0A5N5IY71_9FLAO|nr:ribose-5-phosphate isomerase RpiA [Allomuricauda hadalis]KAB5492123.1 ribose-5-phosphate isomerase RpiA [Allomuricauda hadalis]RUA28573.1 MAG: ribose 5-phosphate isomerase A [Bacteroidota bacterium]